MIKEVQELINNINPSNYENSFIELFFLIIKNNLALSEINEIKTFIEENI